MYRIQRVKKLTTRLTKEKRFLIQRLNNYKQEKQAAMSMSQYAVDERQFRRIKQEPMEPQTHHVVTTEYFCRKRKEKAMSRNPSPAHRFSGDYDAFYDPDFTAEISNKMRVPHRISIIDQESEKDVDTALDRDNERTLAMHVPDRILVREQSRMLTQQPSVELLAPSLHTAKSSIVPDWECAIKMHGGNQHVEGRDPLPETRLEQSLELQPEPILLSTPPHSLKLDVHAYPGIDAEEEEDGEDGEHHQGGDNRNASTGLRVRRKTTLSKLHNGDISFFSTGPTTPPGPLCVEDELLALRRQMRTVTRRLVVIEHENQQRQQREIVLYSVGVLYFLLKGLLWLNRHW
ncbi:hypothetical protein HPB48_011683 [Haemaphysalis longicornis]|uniref:Mitochondrial fission factor n=1 Tax=Haemaphysalis longicornis TaxID=44386 RepID=A0A9J6GDW6_HAELO|nr:hypothetical protein HPB48_011683 [Haemaphysalis longicornis]